MVASMFIAVFFVIVAVIFGTLEKYIIYKGKNKNNASRVFEDLFHIFIMLATITFVFSVIAAHMY